MSNDLGRFSFPSDLVQALITAFTYENGFDPNSVEVAIREVSWKDEDTGVTGSIENGQSTGVPSPGVIDVTIKTVVLTTGNRDEDCGG